METPSSMRRVTRSQASLASQKKLQDDNSIDKGRSTRARSDRSVLLDVTNDSPIVGLADGVLKTPASSVVKCKAAVGLPPMRTPGSGEALLRGQVKTLLQKVEEDTELVKPLSSSAAEQAAPFRVLLSHLRSPGGILAPTPANTPLILGLSAVEEESDNKMVQISDAVMEQQVETLEECQVNRALLFDSPEKSETSATSSVTFQGSACIYREKFSEDDCSSAWSIQVNASSEQGESEEEELEDFGEDEDDGSYDDEKGGGIDDLCDGLSNMSVLEEGKKGLPEFAGKHTRFVYNSDNEIEAEEEVKGSRRVVISPNVVLLKGLPVPEGKHLRFQEEE